MLKRKFRQDAGAGEVCRARGGLVRREKGQGAVRLFAQLARQLWRSLACFSKCATQSHPLDGAAIQTV